jgi:arsenite-transporting ATPase
MAGQGLSFLNNESLKLLLFGGKGGVGKTTLAAATALHWASQKSERKILVISTDPAHSLADSFNQPIGDELTPIVGVSNLFAMEINAARRLEEFKREHGETLKTIADRGTYFDREDIASFFDLSLPGLDELMAVIEMAGLVKEGHYGLVILDTAPTGHTLRLLALPQLMEDWIRVLNQMLEKHRYMVAVIGRHRYRPDETDAFLEHMSADLNRLRALLCNESATEFVPVTIPEAMSIAETARLLDSLRDLHICVRTVVVNRVVVRSECPFCEARHVGQARALEEIQERFSAWNLLKLPLMPHQVRGQETLRGMIRVMLGESPAPLPSIFISQVKKLEKQRGVGISSLTQAQLLLFGGKGGVGKTTIASATALHLARSQDKPSSAKTLLFSTDPAHSLSDSLDQEIGNRITPVNGVLQLFALEMDAADLQEELKREYVAEVDEIFDAFLSGSVNIKFDRQVMEELISLTPPGLDELMALMKIMDFIDAGQFDRYVLDLAPTGHALRFLEMPGMMRKWFVTFFKLLLKYQGVVQLTRVGELLRQRSKQLRQVQKLLVAPERCQFVTVTIPEAMAVFETSHLLNRLAELSVTCRWVVVNMVVPDSECTFCGTVRHDQQPYLAEIDTLAPSLIQVPLFAHEIQGIAGLSEVAETIFGGELNG